MSKFRETLSCSKYKLDHLYQDAIDVDKASNNFGIVCNKVYLEVIQKELGISYNGSIIGNKVYIPVCQEDSDVYKFHKDNSSCAWH